MNRTDQKQLITAKKDNTALSHVAKFTSKHADKLVIVGVAALATTPAFAAIDVTSLVSEIGELKEPINKIGAALLGIAVVILGWRLVRSVLR